MLSIIVFLFTLSVLVIIHEFGHFIVAKKQGVKVERFSFGFGPKLFGIKKGDTEYSISPILLGGYVKMAGDEPSSAKGEPFEFLSKTPGQRFLIVFFGPLLNYILGFLLFWFIFAVGAPILTNRVGATLDKSPAQAAGVLAGDVIDAVDGRPTKSWDEVAETIHNKKSGYLLLDIERESAAKKGKETLQLKVLPQIKEITDPFGKKHAVALIGIAPSDTVVYVKYGLIESGIRAGEQIYKLTEMTCKSLVFLVMGKMSVKESVTGPIGIFIITKNAAKAGVTSLLYIMAVLSTSLAIFNILPLPVLDGGHILFLIIEKIRGKAVNPRVQEVIWQAGTALLIGFMVFVFYADIMRFILKK